MAFRPRFLSARKSFWLFSFYVLLSFLLMATNDASSLRGLRLILLGGIRTFSTVREYFDRLHDMAQENQRLRRENFYLKLTNQQLREALLENTRLRRLLQFKRRHPFKFVAARVIGNGLESSVRSLILDVGQADSVFVNAPVVNADGLVGKIIQVTPHQSLVQILMDHNSLVSARLQFSREVGVIAWDGHPWLQLRYVPKNIPVEIGEPVITSGLSQIFPAGLKIGVVKEVKESKYEFFKEIHVQPAVNFSALEEVFVLLVKPPQKMDLETSE